jgi:hypothetical protein
MMAVAAVPKTVGNANKMRCDPKPPGVIRPIESRQAVRTNRRVSRSEPIDLGDGPNAAYTCRNRRRKSHCVIATWCAAADQWRPGGLYATPINRRRFYDRMFDKTKCSIRFAADSGVWRVFIIMYYYYYYCYTHKRVCTAGPLLCRDMRTRFRISCWNRFGVRKCS